MGGVQLDRATRRRRRRLRRSAVGYVFQRPSDNFFPQLTIRDHLRTAQRGGASGSACNPDEVLEQLGIANKVRYRVGELSGGEQQRAAIAQVLVAGAETVIADEPTAELDDRSSTIVLRSLKELTTRGVSVIVATHDPIVAEGADVLIRLEHGRVVESAPKAAGVAVSVSNEEASWDDVALEAALDVRGLSKSYRRGAEVVHAVRDVSFAIPPGRVVGLVGRSGSGKTTLLNLIAGWERPEAGDVVFAAGGSGGWSRLALVPQHLGLMEELTIRENIEYPARVAGTLEESIELVERLIERLGLMSIEQRLPRETSLGEQQRAAIARALVLAPLLVLGDEPTSHQDAEGTQIVAGELTHAAFAGGTCLVATHDPELLPYLDRVLAMADGQLARAV